MDSLKQYILKKDKKDWIVLLLIGGVTIVGVLYCLHNASSQPQNVQVQDEAEMASSTHHVSLKKYFTEQINRKIDQQEEQYNKTKDEITEQNKLAQSEVELLKKEHLDLQEALFNLKIELAQSQEKDRSFVSQETEDRVGPESFYSEPFNSPMGSLPPIDELEVVSVELENKETSLKAQHASHYVTAGTHIRGVLLGGIDAHTEVYGKNETRVVTIRMIEDGIMPNGFKAPLKNCVLLASAWGNASSERVVMHGERLSCIHDNGRVFEQDVAGIVYGPDGREDVRGRVVYPEGKLVQRAFIAGTLSGLGAGISDGFVTKSVSPLGATSTVNPGEVFSYGAAQGANKSLDKLADYYIKRAEKLQPVVQVPAGVLVDVVFQKGFSLDLAKKNEKPKSSFKTDHDSVTQAHAEAINVLGKFSETYHEE